MHDEIAIQQTLNLYSDGASRGDMRQVLSTFTPDGLYEASGVRLEGRTAIEAATAAYLAEFAYLVQMAAPAVIVVEGDKATARSVIRECSRYARADEVLETLGLYDDELIRTADGWKLTRRSFTPIGSHRLPVSPAPDALADGAAN